MRRQTAPLLLVLALAAAPGCATVSGAEGKALVAAGALLLDVRTAEEFAAGHAPGALHIPIDALEARLGEVEPKDRPVVVYCRSGVRSAKARALLRSKGWARVENLGGLGSWPKD